MHPPSKTWMDNNNVIWLLAASFASVLFMTMPSQVPLAMASTASPQQGVVMLTDSGDLIVNASVGGNVIINGVNFTAQTSTAVSLSAQFSTVESTAAAQSSLMAATISTLGSAITSLTVTFSVSSYLDSFVPSLSFYEFMSLDPCLQL